jgi:hypothetical protein
MNARRQLTLFLSMPAKGIVDHVRQHLDPSQFARIPAHITLCYDDEIQDWAQVSACLGAIAPEEIRFDFTIEGARSFEAEGKGIYLSTSERSGFFELARSRLLATSCSRRSHVKPHITLLHPRHAIDREHGWTLIDATVFPDCTAIHQISLVEFRESRWSVVHTFGRKEPDQSPPPRRAKARCAVQSRWPRGPA